MPKGKNKSEIPTNPLAKRVQALIESEGGEVIKYHKTKKQHHKFTYILDQVVYTYTESNTPGQMPSDQHILKRLRRCRQEASVSIHNTVSVIAEATPNWCKRPGKTPEQRAFEEQMGKAQKQLTSVSG